LYSFWLTLTSNFTTSPLASFLSSSVINAFSKSFLSWPVWYLKQKEKCREHMLHHSNSNLTQHVKITLSKIPQDHSSSLPVTSVLSIPLW
jgi:hypothetical protein